jgi:ubiquinone/menaquinone biosynthesis C-methylase UbiE
VGWEIFEGQAALYERWYATPRGQRVDQAEGALLTYLFQALGNASSVLEVGCGTGHFTQWMNRSGITAAGLDRSAAMLQEARTRFPSIPFVLGEAGALPFRDRSVDTVVFIATLEFLEDVTGALHEAVRVARKGIIAIALNRYSIGGLSRRWGQQSHGNILSRARDYSLRTLRTALTATAGDRLRDVRWASTLFPDGLPKLIARLPVGDVIGMVVSLTGSES